MRLLVQFFGTLGFGGIISGLVIRKINKIEETRQKTRQTEAERVSEENKQKVEKLDNICNGTKILLRAEVYRIGEIVINRGGFTLQEYTDFKEAFNAYKALGGNHQTEEYYNFIIESYKIIDN